MFILMISLSTTLISAILFFDNVRFDDEGYNRIYESTIICEVKVKHFV